MRPCTCNNCNSSPWAAYTLDQCRLCWLYTHEPDYRRLWDGALSASGLALPPDRDGCCGDGQGNRDD